MTKEQYDTFVYMLTESLLAWKHRKAQMLDELQVGRSVSAKQLATTEASINVYEYVLGLLPKEK